MPGVALFCGRHTRPVLHFFKGAAAAFAQLVALAGGADGDAGRVGRGAVPGQPSGHGFGGKAVFSGGVLAVVGHQRVHLGQRPQLGAQRHTIGGRAALAPVVDGGFNVGDVDGGGHGAKVKKICIKTQWSNDTLSHGILQIYEKCYPRPMKLILKWLLSAAALLFVAYIYDGVELKGYQAALIAAFVIGLLNTLVRPILVILTLPVTVVTVGLFLFVINALMFWAAASLLDGFNVTGFWAALIGSIIYSVLSMIINSALDSVLSKR